MLTQLSFFGLLFISVGLSQYSYLGGTPIINILLIMNIVTPAILFFLASLQLTIPIMYIFLLGSSLVITIRDRKKMSMATGRYAMDYDLIFIALPIVATGAIIGSLMKNMLADVILVTAQILLMIYLLIKGFRQNVTPYISYPNPLFSQYLQNPLLHPHLPPYQLQPIQFGQQPKYQQPNHTHTPPSIIPEQQQNPQLKLIIAQQTNRLPKSKIKILIFVILYTIAIVIGKQASSTQLIVINPDINIPDDFNIQNQTMLQAKGKQQKLGSILGIRLWNDDIKYHQQQIQNTDQNKPKQIRSRFEKKIHKYLDTDSYDPQVDAFVQTNQITSCVVASFIFLTIHIFLSYLSSKSIAIQICTKDAQKQKHGFVFIKQTDKMSSTKMWNCIISGFFAGFIVGIFGIGGSIVVIPAWLKSDIDEQTTLISSTPITFFAALISLILTLFSNHNTLPFLLIIIILLLTVLSTVLVNWLANKFVLNRDPKHFRNRVRKILYITSIIGLVLFGLPAYVFNRRFTNYGAFC